MLHIVIGNSHPDVIRGVLINTDLDQHTQAYVIDDREVQIAYYAPLLPIKEYHYEVGDVLVYISDVVIPRPDWLDLLHEGLREHEAFTVPIMKWQLGNWYLTFGGYTKYGHIRTGWLGSKQQLFKPTILDKAPMRFIASTKQFDIAQPEYIGKIAYYPRLAMYELDTGGDHV